MKLVLILIGLALIVIAVVYFVLPADQLPSFFPGHEAGVARIHFKHGLVSGAAGGLLICIAYFMGRR
jgi:hypothetical protein